MTHQNNALALKLTANLRETISQGSVVQTSLPLCPSISLFLISEDYPKGRLPDEEMLAIMEDPAYWAFCWASGQVLARHILDNPGLCRGKTILDLGSGSGVVAIAAAQAGADRVIACDIDQHALDACRENAALNGVTLDLLDNLALQREKVDLLIAADVLYDRDNLEWLALLGRYADAVLIADSRIRDPSVFKDYALISQLTATTIPDLDELKEFGEVSVYFRDFRTSV